MTYEELKERYKSVPAHFNVNKLNLPLNVFPQSNEGVKEFNEVIDLIHSLKLKKTPMTKSGGISIKGCWDYIFTYNVTVTNSSVEILFLHNDFFRFEFRRKFKEDKKEVGGHRAFCRFKEVCKKYGIDIDKFRISTEEGIEAKKQIPKPIIDVNEYILDSNMHNSHHIDIHSAHMAGVAEAFPELYAPINECYNRRKDDEIYKSIMTHTWGYMQSKYSPVNYQLSHLSKAGIESTNMKIKDLTERLKASGRIVLSHNTDGIWYQGEIYHGEGEGKSLGQWSNDHTNCIFRAKSKGVYEFLEDGKVHIVARGYYELDKIKPRDQWEWDDIYYTGKIYAWEYEEATEHLIPKEFYDL